MSKQVVVKETSAPVIYSQEQLVNDWGVPTGPSQDMVVPKILPMQPTSVYVTEGKAIMGEFRDSINGNLIGSIDKPFEIIPFYLEKQWDVQTMQEGQFKYDHSLPLIENPMDANYNDNLKWEEEVQGQLLRRIRRMNFYCLIPSEVTGGGAMPYVLSFKSTSLKEGKKLYTQMYVRNLKAQLPPAAYLFTIGGVRQKNEKGSFIVPNVSLGRRATNEELTECLSWLKLIKKGTVKVDNSDLAAEGSTHEQSGEPTEF